MSAGRGVVSAGRGVLSAGRGVVSPSGEGNVGR